MVTISCCYHAESRALEQQIFLDCMRAHQGHRETVCVPHEAPGFGLLAAWLLQSSKCSKFAHCSAGVGSMQSDGFTGQILSGLCQDDDPVGDTQPHSRTERAVVVFFVPA